MSASADHVATRQCAKRQPPTMAASYSAACAQTRTAKPTGSLQNATHGNRQNNKPPKSGTRLTTHYLNHMRFSRKRNFRSWTPRTSKLAHEAKARKRMEQPCEVISPASTPGGSAVVSDDNTRAAAEVIFRPLSKTQRLVPLNGFQRQTNLPSSIYRAWRLARRLMYSF